MQSYQPDHYRLLGVAPQADADALKSNYRRLSRVFHPDRQGGSEAATERFKLIATAYAELREEESRARYDRLLLVRDPLRFVDDPRAERALDVLDAVVNRIADRRKRLPRSRRGRDLRVRDELDFATATLGGRIEITAAWRTRCTACHGARTIEPARNPTCHICAGSGQVRMGLRRNLQRCGFCEGDGTVLLAPCPTCAGSADVEVERTRPIQVPPRTRSGSILRALGGGEASLDGGPPGDLVVEVKVRPHPLLVAEGDDLRCAVPLLWSQAANGCRVRVPTLEGLEWLRIPPGTPAGRELRIVGRGIPRRGGRDERGDLRYIVQIDSPEGLDDIGREWLTKLESHVGAATFTRVAAYTAELSRLGATEAPDAESP